MHMQHAAMCLLVLVKLSKVCVQLGGVIGASVWLSIAHPLYGVAVVAQALVSSAVNQREHLPDVILVG